MKGQPLVSPRTAELIAAMEVLQGKTADDDAEDEPLPIAPVVRVREIGALVQWEREIRAGVGGQKASDSNTSRRDALYHAAICEGEARDAERDGQTAAANELRRQAAEMMLVNVMLTKQRDAA